MSQNLSEALARLSAKAKGVEDKVAAAKTDAKERLDEKIAESKADNQARKERFIANTESLKIKADENVFAWKEGFNSKIAQIKASIAEKKHEFRIDRAEIAYDDAIIYAESCIEYALIALADVEDAILDAMSAKLNLDHAK